jgi:hypothetical protein
MNKYEDEAENLILSALEEEDESDRCRAIVKKSQFIQG